MTHPGTDRREFLKQGGTLLAGAALTAGTGSLAHAADGPTTPNGFKKAVKWGMIKAGNTVLEKFQLLKKLGYDGVELDAPSNLNREEVLKARDESGLPIHGVVDSVHWNKTLSSPDPAIREAGLAGLKTALGDAKAYGATTTPNMYVVDPRGTLVYSGALDNAPLGKAEGAPVNYVKAAIDDVAAGRAVTTPTTKPYGCGVKYGS